MKTITKVILSVSLSMIVIGAGLSTIAWAVSGGNIGVIWSPQNGFIRMPSLGIGYGITRDTVALDAFESIDVTSDYGKVKLIPSDSYRVEYALFSELPPVEISVENGRLRVDNTTNLFDGINLLGKSPWGDAFGRFSDETYVHIYYPRSAPLTDVTVLNRMGTISAEGLTLSGGLDIKANMGEIKLEDVAAGRVTLRADMGAVKIDRLTAQSLTAELAMGSLDAEDCVVGGNTTVDANMGSVDLQGDFSGDMDVDCAMGSVEVKTSRPRSDYRLSVSAQIGGAKVDGERYQALADPAGAAHTMTIDCSMGGVDLWFGR